MYCNSVISIWPDRAAETSVVAMPVSMQIGGMAYLR